MHEKSRPDPDPILTKRYSQTDKGTFFFFLRRNENFETIVHRAEVFIKHIEPDNAVPNKFHVSISFSATWRHVANASPATRPRSSPLLLPCHRQGRNSNANILSVVYTVPPFSMSVSFSSISIFCVGCPRFYATGWLQIAGIRSYHFIRLI